MTDIAQTMWVTFLPKNSLILHILSLLQCYLLYWLLWFNDVQRDEGQTQTEKHQQGAATTEGQSRTETARAQNSSSVNVLSFPLNSVVIILLVVLTYCLNSVSPQCDFQGL